MPTKYERTSDYPYPFTSLEERASTIRYVNNGLLPNPFQSDSYIEATTPFVQLTTTWSAEKKRYFRELRMGRRDALWTNPPQLHPIIGVEAVRRAARVPGQLYHLEGLAAHPNVTLQIVDTPDLWPGLEYSFTLLEVDGEGGPPGQDDAVSTSHWRELVVRKVDDPELYANHVERFTACGRLALNVEASLTTIQQIAASAQ